MLTVSKQSQHLENQIDLYHEMIHSLADALFHYVGKFQIHINLPVRYSVC